jgi:hypothetical protein
MTTPSTHCAMPERDWTDLEGAICEVRNMSFIVESLGNDLLRCRLKDRKEDGFAHIVLTEDQLNAFAFAFSHAEELARALFDEFYALFEQSREASQ